MFCEQCGKQLSDTDKFCGSCGWLVTANNETPVQVPPVQETPAVEEHSVQAVPVQETPVQAAAPAGNVWAVPTPAMSPVPAEIPAADKKKKTSKLLPIILGGVAVLAILAVVLIMVLPGWFRRNFSSPEKYFQYVAKESVKEYSANMASSYDELLNAIDFVDKNISAEVQWKVSDDVTEMLSMAAGTDMSFLASGSVAANFSGGKEMWGAGAKIGLNDVEIGTMDIIVDVLEDNMYLSLPDFMEKYLAVDMEEMGAEIDEDMFDEFEKVMDIFPESKTLESLMNKYFGIMIECIDDVEKEKDTIKAEGVSQDVIALTVTIDEDTVLAMSEAIFEEMLKDKELKAVIMSLAESMDEDPEEIYEEFIDEIENAMDEVEDSLYMKDEIEFVIYVNDSDEICGFEMELDNAMSMIYVMPKSGGKFGFEACLEASGDEIALVGKGKESGSKLTGDFSLEVDGVSYLDIAVKNYDTEQAAKGYINGEFTITIPSSMADMLAMEMGGSLDFEDYALKIVAETSSNAATVQLVLSEGKDTLADLTVALAIGDQDSIMVPADKNVVWADDEENMQEVLMDFDWKKLLDRLEDADLPSEITDEIEYLIDEIEYMSEFY